MRHGIAVLAGAWVLWDTVASMVGTELKHTWQVEAVYETRDLCERAVSAYLVTWKQRSNRGLRSPRREPPAPASGSERPKCCSSAPISVCPTP